MPKKNETKTVPRTRNTKSEHSTLVVDQDKGLVFSSEDEVIEYFEKPIVFFENEYSRLQSPRELDKVTIDEILLDGLDDLLSDPDEVFEDADSIPPLVVYHYLKKVPFKSEEIWTIATCYVADETPTFIFCSTATRLSSTAGHFKRGFLVFSRDMTETETIALDGDALSEGDDLAVGLAFSMLKVRSDKDIPKAAFADFAELREQTIEDPDEIWRTRDLSGNVLVSFIREISDHELENLHYIVVTQEEEDTKVHALLFSFPTIDPGLIERYRQGENLQAEEIVQESSH